MVLQKLHDAILYTKLEKYVFRQLQVDFLDYIIFGEGLFMDPKKIQIIMEWKKPKWAQDVQCFLGFPNFYQLFIQDYSKIAAPLTCLTCKDLLEWSSGANQAFQDLKTTFTTTLILIYPYISKPFSLENDASDYAFGTVLSQNREDERLHPIVFHSQKCTVVEINSEIHDKELLAIIDSFQEWRHFLKRAIHLITVYTDHKNLEYFKSTWIWNRCQARWSISLSCYNFMITYHPGS
jgi:hypothetical protein